MFLLKRLFLLIPFLLVLPVLAHEFWLQPQQYIFSRGEEINIRFRVGEGFEGDNWSGNLEKVNELKLYYNDIVDDLKHGLSKNPGDSLQVSIFEETTAMITFNSVNSFIELEAPKFNEYLLEDGLNPTIDYRKQNNETDSVGRELYQRSVKTIVQVGTNKTDIYKKQTTLPIDIIPLSHPYNLTNNQILKVKVLYKGLPLANTKIRVWHKLPGTFTDSSFLSDANGEISFPVTTNGEWMVSCVHMIRVTDNTKAQWQSYWGSVTWGYTKNNSLLRPQRGN